MAKALVIGLVLSSSLAHAQRPLQGPAHEVGNSDKVDLPALPAFELPASEPGFESVKGLRVNGRDKLDTNIVVKGYVIWIYDCLDAIRRPRESKAQAQRRIDADPTLCERRKFFLGQTKQGLIETGLWVVDVPRAPNKLERERLPKEELDNWPAVPTVKLGEFVAVTGRFALSSPHNERNSDGLVVFKSIAPATPSPAGKPVSTPTSHPAVPAPTSKPWTDTTSEAAKNRSVKLSNEGTRAYGARNYAEAIDSYTKSVTEWPGNHIAHYGLAGAYIGKKDWPAATAAMEKAVAIDPGEAMYHMVLGYCLYETALAAAKAQGMPANHDRALVHLSHAIRLDSKLWRAHYYIGRIHRERGDDRWAAESFDTAVRASPPDPGPYIALGELYRKWDYPNEALAVAKLGTENVPDAKASSNIWYVAGMAHDDKNDHPKAIAAFTKAIDADPDNVKALYQRGQAYFRKHDNKNAKRDLEAFLRASEHDPSLEFPRGVANKMLRDLGT